MYRDETLVCRAQNVGLGETRTIARRWRGAKRKEGGKGFYGKMRHGFEHRNLNQCALAGPAALHQRAQDAVGRVDSGDRVCESGTQEARTAGVDHNAQEPAEGLGDRIVARTLMDV